MGMESAEMEVSVMKTRRYTWRDAFVGGLKCP
jgi:hypothetical protein